MYSPLNGSHESLFQKYVKILLVVASYWTISIFTVFVNKALFHSDTVKLDATLFVTWYQCVVSALICGGMSFLSRKVPNLVKFPEGSPFNICNFKKVIPLSILFTAMIATNNLCLRYVSVAFYYVSRSLSTVFNVLLTYLILGEKNSLHSLLCCALIVFGFVLGVDQESLTDTFSLRGTIFGVLASLFVSVFSIYTKKTLPYVNQEVLLLSYYNNVYSCFLFIPLIYLTGEIDVVLHYTYLNQLWFWFAMTIGGFCGFAIGFITALQIKYTSALTHNISGTAKACAQTVIATTWYNETKSLLWWSSNYIVLIGSFLYARVKQLEMAKRHRENIQSNKV